VTHLLVQLLAVCINVDPSAVGVSMHICMHSCSSSCCLLNPRRSSKLRCVAVVLCYCNMCVLLSNTSSHLILRYTAMLHHVISYNTGFSTTCQLLAARRSATDAAAPSRKTQLAARYSLLCSSSSNMSQHNTVLSCS
jgi:hypothetical protein